MPRLSKVTKELNVGLQTCIDFLQKKGYTVENSLNAKINDEQYELLVIQFSQDKDVRLKAEQAQRERMSSKMEAKAAVAEEPKKAEPKKEAPAVEEEKPAVTFKVVGKINLDGDKKEEPKAEAKPEPKPEPVADRAPAARVDSRPDRRPSVIETIACACSSESPGFSAPAKSARSSSPCITGPSNLFMRFALAVGVSGEERMMLMTSSILSIASL